MNIYLFELKNVLKSCFWWTFSIVVTLIVFMIAIYPIFQEGGEELVELFNNFPPEFLTAFGFNLENLFGIEPFYAFGFTYIGLMFSIMAVSISVDIFSREKRSKCIDFILTKPIGRIQIYMYKLAACLTGIILSNIIYAIFTIIVFCVNTEGYNFNLETLLIVLAPFFTQLVFVSFGIIISITFRKIRSVSVVATSFGIIAFILSAITNLLEKEYLYFLAPLKYFEPSYVVHNGAFDIKLVAFAIILIVVLISLSMKKYCSEDIRAV